MAKQTLTPELIRRITDHLLIEQTELYPADLGFVFGNAPFCDELAKAAADHYHKGHFKRAIISGAPRTSHGLTEARHIFNAMAQQGVPKGCMLLEEQSRNTQENIEFSKEIIDREIGLGHIKSVIGFGQLYAARRYIMTLKRRWPEVFAMHVSVNGFPVARDDWHKHEAMRDKVLLEWQKLSQYKHKDFIHEVDIDHVNRTVHTWRQRKAGTGRHYKGPDWSL